jgi:hypothetical protein
MATLRPCRLESSSVSSDIAQSDEARLTEVEARRVIDEPIVPDSDIIEFPLDPGSVIWVITEGFI